MEMNVSPINALPPRLTHTLHHQQKSSVLSLAADERHIFSGCQTADIYVWDRSTFQVKTTLHGHTGSVLALEIAHEKEWLFSSSSDSTVRIWSTNRLIPLYILTPHLDTSSGDIFSLIFSPTLQTLYFGCQNTSLQWYDFSKTTRSCSAHRNAPSVNEHDTEQREFEADTGLAMSLDRKKWHRFFDNTPRLGRPVVFPNTPSVSSGTSTPVSGQPRVLQVSPQNIVHSAHFGYIYCMALLPSPLEDVHQDKTDSDHNRENENILLITGSGDETVKVWRCASSGPLLERTFACDRGGVLSLVARDGTVYAGCQDGCVAVWDLETGSIVRLILAQENSDVLSLSMIDTDLYTCSANGWVQRWSAQFACTASWRAHAGIILSSIVTNTPISSPLFDAPNDKIASETWNLVTGANDNDVKLWEIDLPRRRPPQGARSTFGEAASVHDPLLQSLSQFISIPSVSNSPQHREDCRQAAIWLKRCLSQFGADATMIATGQGTNPLVLATFKGVPTDVPKPRLLFYGHYDVIGAPSGLWKTNPFTLTGLNGYLYGRGVTDNKGPILAVACAASDLLRRRALACDVVFLIEGEEEAGSSGFADAVRSRKSSIGDIDALLVSNSYWIGEETPCITYGLRGVVHATIDISSAGPDLHSGVEGGSVMEPMIDMIKLLARLTGGSKVLVPGFYDQVRPQTAKEQELYQLLASITHKPASSLSSRWREPSLSIHSVETSESGNAAVIPSRVRAKVSIRIVPDQDLDTIAKSLVDHVRASFDELQSPNTLQVCIDRTADWWLGDLESRYFKALECSVQTEWGVQPLRIREGGSIPSVPFLEKEFACPALHLPMGQSSDQAHLPNERTSLINLRKGKSVVERFLLFMSIAE
ncbi:Zn-dependent exopeptidase [Ramaria rubella]|nr:Zn-dependent exopeptidase [Ramaria rubella]